VEDIFDGPEEETKALSWMLKILDDIIQSIGKKKTDQMNEIIDLSSQIKIKIELLEASMPFDNEDFYENLWDRFIFSVSGKWLEEENSWQPPYQWGEWEFMTSTELKFGHSENLLRTIVPEGGGPAKHEYSAPFPDISWKLIPIVQKNRTFYIGKAKVSEIDAVCSVPQLPSELDSIESALRVLDKNRGDKEWQRRVDAKRIISIRRFIGQSDNLIANSAILYSPSDRAVKIDKDGAININSSMFLENFKDNLWADHKGKIDLRPIWLIDGQHRTRGLAQSEIGIEMEIPIIFFPSTFNLSDSAKIFAEINTLQTKLSNLHTLFMQHRFNIPSPIAKRDFQAPWDNNSPNSRNSRANHLSYECAAYLSSNPNGPLENRIKFLDSNSKQFTIIQASQWLDFSRRWFSEGGIYAPGCPESQADINKEVENYFTAFVEVCNHSEWDDGRDRWCLKAKPKGLVQRHGPSKALLDIYPTVIRKAKRISGDSVVSVKIFKEILNPLTWVDWLDPRLKKTFGGSGERPRTALRVWLETAIKDGNKYDKDSVMSDEIQSKAGQGMLASPGNDILYVVEENHNWPHVNKPITLCAVQPKNTLSTSVWQILDSDGQNRTGESTNSVSKLGVAEKVINYSLWMENIEYLDIRVEWFNTVGPPGFTTIKLIKP